MYKILTAIIVAGLAGRAYAADFGELAVKANTLEASIKAESIAPARADAPLTYNIQCKYSEPDEAAKAEFILTGTYMVSGKDSAALTYSALINYLAEEFTYSNSSPHVFSVGENLKNDANYSGAKYKNHFKFTLAWHSVGAEIEKGNLIISKEPVKTEKDQHGATVRTFTGALDVSYNDHHGNYADVVCTHRSFSGK